MSEFIVVLPLVLLLALGGIQFGLLYEAKATLNMATFQAARAGALNQGNLDAMKAGLADGLRALFTHGTGHSAIVGGLNRAREEVFGATPYAKIEIINPSKDTACTWKEGVIPNDNLSHAKDTTPAGITIQDANLLKIRVTYCYPLQVPFINRTIVALLDSGSYSPGKPPDFDQTCYESRRLPISAQAIVRMQSSYRYAGKCNSP